MAQEVGVICFEAVWGTRLDRSDRV